MMKGLGGAGEERPLRKDLEPFVISRDDIAGLQCSPLCKLKGIQPLSGFRFGMGGMNLLPKSGSFQFVFHHIIPALWACEVITLIARAPPDLQFLLQAGNYHPISKLTGEFHFFSNPVEYFFELGRSLALFHSMGGNPLYTVFTVSLMTVAVNNFNTMTLTSDKMAPEAIEHMIAVVESMERGEVSNFLPAASLQIVKHAIEQKKSLKELGAGVIEIFSNYLPAQQFPRKFGLIGESQMNTLL